MIEPHLVDKYFICVLKFAANKCEAMVSGPLGFCVFQCLYNQENMKSSILFCPSCIYVPPSLCGKPLQSEWLLWGQIKRPGGLVHPSPMCSNLAL